MAVPLIGEILDDGVTLAVLPDGGTAAEAAYAASTLQTLTPLFEKAPVPGALVTPLSWATVVQISRTFGDYWRPQPRLRAWLAEQVVGRTTRQPMVYESPAGITPFWWQAEGADIIAATGRALITDEPGCIYGDAEIIVNRGGAAKRTTLGELVRRFNGGGYRSRWGTYSKAPAWDLTIPTMVQREVDGVVRLGRVVNAWCSGVKTTYTVTTETGRTIRATDEHPFLTERGWLRLDELEVGDLVHVRGTQQSVAERKPKPRYREIAGLYGHPHARGLGRRTSTHRVAYHRLVVEAQLNGMETEEFIEACRKTHRSRSLAFLHPGIWAVHHKDHDHTNNAPSNLELMSHAAHHRLHADEGKANQVLYKIAHERVVSVELYGEEETFDIEVEDDPHNFIADGFVVHNTGKTGTAVLGLVEQATRSGRIVGQDGPVVVVCPASVIDSWVREWKMWAPHVDVVAWRGADRKDKLTHQTGRGQVQPIAQVYITSYDTARMDASEVSSLATLLKLGPTALIVDECHFIKNPTAARTRAVIRIAKAVHKAGGAVVGLSGTPITRDTGDLHPILQALDSGAWASKERFVKRYCMSVQGDYDEQILGLEPMREPEFRLCLLGQHRRIAKADVLPDLPAKVYSVRTVELPQKWRKVYDDFKASMYAEMPDGTELSVFDEMSAYTHLSALSSAPGTVEVTYGPDVDEETGELKRHVHIELNEYDPKAVNGGSWKVSALLEILEERRGRQTIVFAPSRQLVEIAGKAAVKAGHRVGYVVGGQAAGARTADIDAFQAGQLDVICVTTKAGGVGLTLTAADAVVFLQRPWELDESIQAEDRAHRIGAAHESLQIIDIVAKDTIDGRRRESLPEKARHLAEFVQDARVVDHLLGGKSVTEHQPTTATSRELISA